MWLDPNESSEISQASSRRAVRTLIKDGLIIKKPVAMHSRARVRLNLLAKRKGRHMGPGKRRGTKEARMPSKILWIRRQRVLRRLLSKYREQGKIDSHIYRHFYVRAKGNMFKNKRVLIEAIHKKKADTIKSKTLIEQTEARKAKARIAKEKKEKKAADKAQE
jgi:large subunit ribosomal protein L19e